VPSPNCPYWFSPQQYNAVPRNPQVCSPPQEIALQSLFPSICHGDERSLVVRLRLPSGVVLIPGDIGASTEFRVSRLASLACHVLIVPHHGSRGSSSSVLLAASAPEIALIPAGPQNIHHHPHPEVLERLAARTITVRYPARDGRCGANYDHGRWLAFP